MYSQNVYQNQRVLCSLIYIKPVLTSCEECNTFEDLLFFRSYFCLCRDFCQPACLFAAQFTLKTALNYHEGCNEFADRLFERSSLWIIFPFERLFVLCQPLIRSLCFIQVYIFIPPDTFCPILGLFTHFACTNFFICILPCGIFLLSLMTPLIGESSEFNFNF